MIGQPDDGSPPSSSPASRQKGRVGLRLIELNDTAVGPAGVTVMVCAGDHCQVGSPVDTDRALDVLRPVIASSVGGILVRSTGCPRPCLCGTLVVVHRRAFYHSRSANGPTVWVMVDSLSVLHALAGWIAAGGPGVAPMPTAVDEAVMAAS